MNRGIKKAGGSQDSNIVDAEKRMKVKKAQLKDTSGYTSPNEADLLNEQLEQQGESETIRNIFGD